MTPLKTIAYIRSDFPTKFGIPRQSSVVETLQATIVFEPEYRNPDALRGLESFSHIWLIWGFSETEKTDWSPTVRPPRLGGNARMGVFATRSPFRPNALGLSSVKISRIEMHPEYGPVIHVLGADLMDKTPIYDIKPYLTYTDSHPEAVSGFANEPPAKPLKVSDPNEWVKLLPEEKRSILYDVLACDPRPPYQRDPLRIYGMEFAGFEVKFSVGQDVVMIHSIAEKNEPI